MATGAYHPRMLSRMARLPKVNLRGLRRNRERWRLTNALRLGPTTVKILFWHDHSTSETLTLTIRLIFFVIGVEMKFRQSLNTQNVTFLMKLTGNIFPAKAQITTTLDPLWVQRKDPS